MLTGSFVALVTPMLKDGSIDWQALERLIYWHIEQETDAIVIAGTTGESATLSTTEHCAVIEAAIKIVKQKIPIIAGTGANATSEAIALTQAAGKLGADACLLVAPYYNKPTQEGLYQHYQAIAEAVAIPQILYNVPGRTACDITTETVLRLAELDNIVGIKEATGDMERARALIKNCPDDFAIYSGDDFTAIDLILSGGHGSISVTANLIPATLASLIKTALSGDQHKAQAIQNDIMPLHQAMFVESNPIPVKWALSYLGRIQPYMRLPLTPLDKKYHTQVKQALAASDLTTSNLTTS